MKIAVCGCSFSAVSHLQNFSGTHWSEILAKNLGAELHNYARQGISNSVIRLQIEEAIKIKPDWVFINATTPDRIEFPVDNNRYNKKLGLKNFNYFKDDNVKLISETMFSVIDNHPHEYRRDKVSKPIRDAVSLHAALIYEIHWQQQKDNWLLNSGLWKLHDLNIKFLYNPWVINHKNMPFHDLPIWFTEKYFLPFEFNLLDLFNKFVDELVKKEPFDVGYHTPVDEQKNIAEQYLNLMKLKES